jgi:hypothetical protein
MASRCDSMSLSNRSSSWLSVVSIGWPPWLEVFSASSILAGIAKPLCHGIELLARHAERFPEPWNLMRNTIRQHPARY